jgi:long-chain acyl-CoA synthetase
MISIVEAIGQRAVQHPDKVALHCGDQQVTYGQLWSRVNAAACYLADNGVRPGERVLLPAPSVPAFVYGYFATHLVGGIAVMLDPNASVARREDLVRRTRPALTFGTGSHGGADVRASPRSIHELATLAESRRAFVPPALDAVADLVFTTGTTGRPKGVRLTHGNIATATSHVNAVTSATADDVTLIPIPLYHNFGLGSLRCFLSAGAAVVLVQGFRLPGEIFKALADHAATGLIGVPAGYAVLLKFGERGLGPFAARLRYLEVGSAPMPHEHKRMLMEILPHTRLFMHYGLTEAARSAYSEFHRDSARLDTVGLPSPGVQIETRDENGRKCGVGERGMMWIRGGHVSTGYWEEPELNAMTFVDGWMRTGDIAHLDADGYIHLHGRHDDIVNVGGNKVAPEEVENVLSEHPAVSEAACIGVPDPRNVTGQTIRAHLVLAPGQAEVTDAELSNWVSAWLEPYKVPTQYRWVGTLPRSASGKLFRAVLRKEAATER